MAACAAKDGLPDVLPVEISMIGASGRTAINPPNTVLQNLPLDS